jgi:hypothetical protein
MHHRLERYFLRLHPQQQEIEMGEKVKKAHQDKIKQSRLIDLHEVLIPGLDFILRRRRLIVGRFLIIDMILTILYNLC